MEVFELSEVAKILSVPKSRVKNWTIGRPLQIKPTVRIARGKGSRNLYGTNDVYLIALANQLYLDGFDARAIRGILREARPGDWIGTGLHVLMFSGAGQVVKFKLFEKFTLYARGSARDKAVIGWYTLDLKALRKQVDGRIAELRKQNPA